MTYIEEHAYNAQIASAKHLAAISESLKNLVECVSTLVEVMKELVPPRPEYEYRPPVALPLDEEDK